MVPGKSKRKDRKEISQHKKGALIYYCNEGFFFLHIKRKYAHIPKKDVSIFFNKEVYEKLCQ